MNEQTSEPKQETLPLIPLKNVVMFPHVTNGLSIGRSFSILALEEGRKHRDRVIFVAQRLDSTDSVHPRNLYSIGTIGRIKQVFTGDVDTKVLVIGEKIVKILEYIQEEPFFKVRAEIIETETFQHDSEITALTNALSSRFREYVNFVHGFPMDIFISILSTKNPHDFINLIVSQLDIKVSDRQKILEETNIRNRLDLANQLLSEAIEVQKLEKKVTSETERNLGKLQREAYLREQLRSIQRELGEGEGGDFEEIEKKIAKAKMPKEVEMKALKELSRLRMQSSFSPESSYIRTYLDWLCDVPWIIRSDSKISVKKAEDTLNSDHYGLKKIKERVLEYLAVQQRVGKIKGPILCFVGPPGVGKTSLGQSIAKSLNRKFVRVSLGGIRDEAEIRGHRRTYVGALPGRIIQGIHQAKTKNPVFMLDEIDKVGSDWRGDPSSALLEALDPEQNEHFSDHYLEVPFDLSDVMFITTANLLDTIPPALRDRLEVIPFAGYTDDEKYHIANDYLIPKQLKNHGFKKRELEFSKEAIDHIISRYTREAGVRNVEREIAAICRKVMKRIAEKRHFSKRIEVKHLSEFLGPERFHPLIVDSENQIGAVNGLAVTQAGGELLTIETTLMPGKGSLILTGQLGDVMKESATAALSYIRSSAERLNVNEKFFHNKDIHVHVPAGAVQKDGPSAGIAIACAILSAVALRPVRKDVAMTGEITLRGRVMEIGGVKEKVLAAHRSGIKKVILPKENKKDYEEVMKELPEAINKDMEFRFVNTMTEAIPEVFIARSLVKKRKTEIN